MNKELASLCVLTYNQIDYVEDAVTSALNQDYSPLEIIFSDDGSSDGTFEKIKEIVSLYKGPHKVVINQNNSNLGIREHVNKVLYDMSHGKYLLLGAGDDISDAHRVSEYVGYFQKFPDVMSISCLSKVIDKEGKCLNPTALWNNKITLYSLDDYASWPYFFMNSGDSRGIRRDVITSFHRMQYSRDEDIFLYIRSLLLGSALYIRSPLVSRRMTGNNTSASFSSKALLSGMRKQLDSDIKYAYDHKYIRDNEYQMAKQKLNYLMDYFCIYTTNPKSSLKVLFYRLLRHNLKLIRYYPVDTPWQ